MIRAVSCMLALGLPLAPVAASDAAVLPPGRYGCWTAGSATGPAKTIIPDREFIIVRGSSYRTATGAGTYLLADGLLTFTRGPLKDTRLRFNKGAYWQEIARDGEPAGVKCSRAGDAPNTEPAQVPRPVSTG